MPWQVLCTCKYVGEVNIFYLYDNKMPCCIWLLIFVVTGTYLLCYLFTGGKFAATQARYVKDDIVNPGNNVVSVGCRGTADVLFHLTVTAHCRYCCHTGSCHRQADSVNRQSSDNTDGERVHRVYAVWIMLLASPWRQRCKVLWQQRFNKLNGLMTDDSLLMDSVCVEWASLWRVVGDYNQ